MFILLVGVDLKYIVYSEWQLSKLFIDVYGERFESVDVGTLCYKFIHILETVSVKYIWK